MLGLRFLGEQFPKRLQRSDMEKENGFSLIETLLVLSLVSFIVSMPILHFNRLKIETETQLFFESLESSITLVQSHAILNNEWTVIEFSPSSKQVSFRVAGDREHPLNHRLYLPESMSMASGFMEYNFNSETGNQSNLKKLRFYTSKGEVEFGFLFGSGRFSYEYK